MMLKADSLAGGDQPFGCIWRPCIMQSRRRHSRALFGDAVNVQGFGASGKDFLKGAQ
jgi:hypothetical protein